MSSRETLESIQEINLAYVRLAQRLLAEDKAVGMLRLGLTEGLADLLVKLTPDQVKRLASSNHLLCLFRVGDQALLSALTRPGKMAEATQAVQASNTRQAAPPKQPVDN